jgi:hypothetical protein
MICKYGKVTCTHAQECAPLSALHAEKREIVRLPVKQGGGGKDQEGVMGVGLIIQAHSPSGRLSHHVGKGLCFLLRET